MPGYLGLFVDSLAARCEEVVCFQHSPVGDELAKIDYALKSANTRLVNIGPHTSIPVRTASAYANRELYHEWRQALDVMLVRAPTPLLPVLASAWNKPLSILLVGDYMAGIDELQQPGWRKALIRFWTMWYQAQQFSIAKDCLVFVNSRLLYNQLHRKVPNLVETRTTTLSEQDFFQRADTCEKPPYRLLYAGRMARIKGLFEIVETLAQLVNAGFDLVLDLVGMVERGDPVLEELEELARSLGVTERVSYKGYKTAGPELLAYYRRADIYITASRNHEGFPRTIWEAMGSSLPVVATQVGSIPAFIGDAAILVPPKNTVALAGAVRELLENPGLRQNLIRRGMALVHDNTLEQRAGEMVSLIEGWLESGAGALGENMQSASIEQP